MRTILALLLLAAPVLADNCRNQNVQQVVVADTGLTLVPFAVPIATPIASVVAPGVMYSANVQAQAYSPQVAPQAATKPSAVDPAEWEAFLAWKASRPQAAAAPKPLSLISAKCQRCHTPGGEAVDKFNLTTANDAELRHAIGIVALGEMPPPKVGKLSPEDVGKIIHELSTKPAAGAVKAQVEANP